MIGKLIRLERIIDRNSRRTVIVPMDHGVTLGPIPGLQDMKATVSKVVAGGANALIIHKGIVAAGHRRSGKDIGLIVHLSGSTSLSPDPNAKVPVCTVEEAIRLGADAVAVAAFLKGTTEAAHIRMIADCVREAARYGLPVISHAYSRDFTGKVATVSFKPEDIAWAAHCAVECGADVVKVPYCGDVTAYKQIVADCPVPLVAAGGPQAKDLEAALGMMAEVVQSGARGATIGRNIWGVAQITAAVHAFKAVILDGKTPKEAMRIAGLQA
jgi:predicted phospho-2-dehydro-3-deoxyheptonate aldolase